MADPRLLQALDYILNHSDEASIDALGEAVARRRRDLTVFNAIGDIPDPQKMAREITEKINSGVGGSIDSMRRSIQDMIIKLLKEHAPELSDAQMNELCQAWLPDQFSGAKSNSNLPPDVLLSMIEQFVSFSHGEMKESVDKSLREEIGAWPERYWNAFPPVIRQIITDYLKDKISAKEYKSQIAIALGI
ncbi:MAG: hypothetical protein FWB86_11600 [Treponema sp.]|nr:hypothetical protein [Treponema sp.]